MVSIRPVTLSMASNRSLQSLLVGTELYAAIFFFNDTPTTEIYTLSLHDALPIYRVGVHMTVPSCSRALILPSCAATNCRSEEHTSELQSQSNLVCRLLLEKKNAPQHADIAFAKLHVLLH